MATIPRRALRRPPLLKGGYLPVRYAPQFDGLTQYALLPDINLVAGDVISFEIISPIPSGLQMLLSNTEAYKTVVRINDDGTLVSAGGTVTPISVTPGTKQLIEFTATSNVLVNLVAAQSDGAGGFLRFVGCPIFNLKVNDGSVWNFPMNDKDRDPVMRNTGSGGDGTYVNSTPAMWVEV